MTIDLGISSFECDCGCMIYPPSTISTKAHKKHIEKIELPSIEPKSMLNHRTWDDIQSGLHDDNPDLVQFKGMPYADCISTLRAEHKTWWDDFVIAKRSEAEARKSELSTKAKTVVKTETKEAITIEAERFEANYEGNDTAGRTVCPECGNVLCSWKQ